ncbi:histidine ammonia-lyase [Ktedonospora formicarum]|uniref:Histidine ammonia-lyase n=1 Tax=Ktedonospora formicarum TaxID=2778364 RepID=A0A8J3HYF7_9CHLR|nr:histidine ammonia-lyase [Ktedonospora formicarum]GHO44266.1 histidine ammonia-lyase [Ktedonospora formicarum]
MARHKTRQKHGMTKEQHLPSLKTPPTAEAQGNEILIDGEALTSNDVLAVARHNAPVALAPSAVELILAARAIVNIATEEGRKVYGVTTGFGHLSSVRIPQDQLVQLQHNLIRSHAAGVGEPLSIDITRAMMLLLAGSLARGNSGVRVEVVQQLLALLNQGITPIIPSRGSVGASGDLAPLAHLALVLIGEGEADYQGERLSGGEALLRAGLEPLHLQAKEGLALINGTHLMEAIAILALADARILVESAEVACAMSIEALMGSHVPLDPRIHRRRGQAGQQVTATRLRQLLHDSEIRQSHEHCPRVQDPYTLRCAPQVIGAVRDALDYCQQIFERELNAVTDNPLIFPEDGAILSGGNFHGQPLALALDTLAIAMTQLASFAERRVYNLMGPHEWDTNGAPLFLTPNPGLNSGFMIAQYAAAALVNEIKILAHPASIDSIPTSAGMEDFVSMGVTSAHKLLRLLELARQVIAIELLCAAQMLEFRLPLKPGAGVQIAYQNVRAYVAKLEEDRVLAPDIAALASALQEGIFAISMND